MSTITLLALAASTWGIAMALSPVLQIRTMIARRSSGGISLAYLAVLNVGFALWLVYAVALGNVALAVPNAVAFLVGTVTLAVAVRLRRYARA
jgi:MtN3 and saliva related transmembrane protein